LTANIGMTWRNNLNMATPTLINISRSLTDLLGKDYTQAVCEAKAFVEGKPIESFLAIANEKVEFFPPSFQARNETLVEAVGEKVVSGYPTSSPGASTTAFNKATHTNSAPLVGYGMVRIGEDGKAYLISKSEHYHASLGHDFPGYHLVENAKKLGIANVTHNNTRGHVTRLLEEELIRVVNGLPRGDSAALQKVVQSNEAHVLNRVTNLETGSLAVEAALKMMLARFYRLEDTFPQPKYAGRTPVFLVLADHAGGKKANYHGTTILTQMLRGMWPDLYQLMEASNIYVVKSVAINDYAAFEKTLQEYDHGRYKVAGFFHEIVLMNYGGILVEKDYLQKCYQLCHQQDVPVIVDEIQSCIWSGELFLYREYGLDPDFVSVGKGFPGGQYPASRVLCTAEYDNLNQFGALVTNGQEELAAVAYLVTMEFVQENSQYVTASGQYYEDAMHTMAGKFPKWIDRVEGHHHLSSLFFHSPDKAVEFMKAMNTAGFDVSAQTYKAECPPAILTKLPVIVSYKTIDLFVENMSRALSTL
jgi:acetylornithine/succinyldiaminopimelate/putrescine aminotransferase